MNKFYCEESNCNNEISYSTFKYGQGRCSSCEMKRRFKLKIMNHKGKNHPMFGKKHSKKTKIKMSKIKRGKKSNNWKGGRTKLDNGYILIHKPNHPYRDVHGYVYEHRLVAEKYIGRYLNPKETIHHINENKSDNKSKNLLIFEGKGKHILFHSKVYEYIFVDKNSKNIIKYIKWFEKKYKTKIICLSRELRRVLK